DNPAAAYEAVRMVNMGIRTYVGKWHKSGNFNLALGQQAVVTDGRHVSNPNSFGRHPEVRPEKLSDVAQRRVPLVEHQKARLLRGQMNSWLAAFNEPDLARQIGLHDLFLKVYCTFESPKGPGGETLTPTEMAATMRLRETWYDGDERGRKDNLDFKKA